MGKRDDRHSQTWPGEPPMHFLSLSSFCWREAEDPTEESKVLGGDGEQAERTHQSKKNLGRNTISPI